MNVAVIGAGVAGLTAAHELTKQGHRCDVYERWPGLGGQAATLDVGDGHLLERYYHHLFVSDTHIAELCDQLGLDDEIEWWPSSVAIFLGGRTHAFTSPLDILRFSPLSPLARVRMGLAVLLLQRRQPDVEPFEDMTAFTWIERNMGKQVLDRLWGPLLRAKFSERAPDLSMAWLWSKFRVRRQLKGGQAKTEMLGYPRRSFEPLYGALQKSIEDGGGRVLIDRAAARIEADGDGYRVVPAEPQSFRGGHDPRSFERLTEGAESYDSVVATVPSDIFEQLLDEEVSRRLADGYLERLSRVEYHEALCMILEIDRQFSPYYWTNVADELPFIGVIEHTNLVPVERYGGRRFLYIANYKPRGHPLLDLDAEALLDVYEPGLRAMNSSFSREWIKQKWLFREPAAQPVVTTGYQRNVQPLKTGSPGLILANTTQVYPEDRGTNYAVRLGRQAAEAVRSQHDARAMTATTGGRDGG